MNRMMAGSDHRRRLLLIWDGPAAGAPRPPEGGWEQITPRSWPAFIEWSNGAGARLHGVLLLAELRWEGSRRSDLHGLELVARLRAEHDLRCPIVICSFFPRHELVARSPLLRWVRHHPFLRLPALPEQVVSALEVAEAISDERMPHVLSYCDPLGRIERVLTHGTGFIFYRRASGCLIAQEQVWPGLERDGKLLSRYLAAAELNPSVVAAGTVLLDVLRSALSDRSPSAAAAVQAAAAETLATLHSTRSG